MKFILGKKIGMTTIYTKEQAQHVTLIEAVDNVVVGVKNQDKDGYVAVQLEIPLFKKKNVIREFRLDEASNLKKGEKVTIEQFKAGDKVIIKGISKGKGYQGVVKRHGFAGSPASHGHRHDLRAPGSIGSAFPERVMKGKRMAGRMGFQSVTAKNLEIVQVDADKKLLAIKGAVPGNNRGLIKVFSN